MDYTLDESSMEASALWLEAWSLGRSNPALAAEADALTDQWLACIAEVVREGNATGEFHARDAEVAARRLLTHDRRARRSDGGARGGPGRAQAHRPVLRRLRVHLDVHLDVSG